VKAMILGAGKGTRVQPLTHELPKPMVPILGKPLMAYLIEHLARNGVLQVMVNTSHLAPRIENYFGDGQRFGVHIGYSFEGYVENGEIVPLPLGSAGGLKKVQDFGGFFDSTAVILCGDALIDLDIAEVVAEHRARGALASLVCKQVPLEDVSNYGVVVSDADGRIRSFQEKPARAQARSNWVNTGIYVFEPEVLDLIPSHRVFDIGSDLFPLLVEKGLPFYAQKRDFSWIDIGRISDYWSVTQRLMRHEVAGITIPGNEAAPGLHTGLNTHIDGRGTRISGPVYVGSGCHIERDCVIEGPTWIGHGSHIRQGAQLTRSIIFEHTRVDKGARFHEQIVSGRYCVDRHGHPSNEAKGASGRSAWTDARVLQPALAM
jgi:mannose-1-phosphate guanylyltransferase